MNEINYIEEIDYWLKQLRDEIKVVKFNVVDNGISFTKKVINDRCNNLILYSRALRDKLYESEYEYLNDTYDPYTTKLMPGFDIDDIDLYDELYLESKDSPSDISKLVNDNFHKLL
jgi:hypothetical protein